MLCVHAQKIRRRAKLRKHRAFVSAVTGAASFHWLQLAAAARSSVKFITNVVFGEGSHAGEMDPMDESRVAHFTAVMKERPAVFRRKAKIEVEELLRISHLPVSYDAEGTEIPNEKYPIAVKYVHKLRG